MANKYIKKCYDIDCKNFNRECIGNCIRFDIFGKEKFPCSLRVTKSKMLRILDNKRKIVELME